MKITYIKLNYDEAEALIQELKHHYFSRDNPYAEKVYDKLVQFIESRQPELKDELDK